MLKVNHLFVSFTKEYYTLNDISFELASGQKLVIVGNKESGRTAMLRAMLGLESMSKGEVFYKNISLEKIDFENDINVGYLPTTPVFLENKSVKQNIEYVLKLRKDNQKFLDAKVNNALVGYGLDFIKNNKVKELNYLDRIKLAIARLSVRNLDLLLIDDIFTKLSTNEKNKIIKSLKSLIKTNNASALIMVDNDDIASEFGYPKKYLIYGSLQDTENYEFNN